MPEEFRDAIDAASGDAVADAIDLGAVAASAPEPERAPRKRRGRPPGSGAGRGKSAGAGKEKVKGALDLSSLTGLFVGIHVIVSNATGVPELIIDQQEADTIAKAAQNVARHYNVETTQKTLDWISLFGALGMVYGTRFGAYMIRKKGEQVSQRPAATVYQMPSRPPSNAQPAPQPEQHVPFEADFTED